MPRHYECECMSCGVQRTIAFQGEPYPKPRDTFLFPCPTCGDKTNHCRVMNGKTIAELRREQQEQDLRSSIVQKCGELGFRCRFLYQSVIITTQLADWCFDYHQSRITLYHESTLKINFETGNYAKSHLQFANRKMKPLEVIAACHSAGCSDIFIEFILNKINLTLDWALTQITGENAYLSEQVRLLLDVMEYDVPYTAAQIMAALGLKSKENLRKLYIGPALQNGLIIMGLPDKPTSRNQTYIKK